LTPVPAPSRYHFQLDYCMRRSLIKRRFSEFLSLQAALAQEVPRRLGGRGGGSLPGAACYTTISLLLHLFLSPFLSLSPPLLWRQVSLPLAELSGDPAHRLLLGDKRSRGSVLAAYLTAIHASLASRGRFSPRLLAWLGVDVVKVRKLRRRLG